MRLRDEHPTLLAGLAELAQNVDLCVVGCDLNPDLMDPHVITGARSVPVVTVLDERRDEAG